jgi:tetratricopeptide (TPR) repeat protein
MMIQPAPTGDDDLFYAGLIYSYVDKTINPRFVERHWLKKQVEEKLADPNCRFLLLTAEPGAGKSAFMAWLAHQHPNWCRYFIRRDQRTLLGDPGAHSFLLQIGFQLASTYPHLFNQEQVKITVAQRISQAEGSEIVGAEIEKMFASPFYQKVVQIQQEVTRNQDNTVVGIRIGEWYADNRSLPLTNLQFMALFDPATVMLKQERCQIVVLVDALDELRYRDPELSLLKWLADCPELPANLRFVITSRPDDALLNNFRGTQQSHIRELRIEEEDPEVEKDLTRYAHLLVETQPKVQEALAGMNRDADTFSSQAVKKANGNFGYLDTISRAVDQAIQQGQDDLLQEVLKLSQLPSNLQELYAFFLGKIKEKFGNQSIKIEDAEGEIQYVKAWSDVYKPILGVLAVAREPLSLAQIQKLGSIQAEFDYLTEAIESLRQFLDRLENCYRLYHSTLPEFLTSPKTKENADYSYCYVDALKQNQRIVNYYRGKTPTWRDVDWNDHKKVDDYGLRHLAVHLYTLIQIAITTEKEEQLKTYRKELYELICKSFMLAKFARFGSDQPFAEDVQLTIATAQSESPLNLAQEVRSRLLHATLGSLATDVHPEVIGALVKAGEVRKAEGYVTLMQAAEKQSKAYLLLGEALLEQKEKEKAREFLLKALTIAEKIEWEHERVSVLSSLVQPIVQIGEFDQLLAALEKIEDERRHREMLDEWIPTLIQMNEFNLALTVAEKIMIDGGGVEPLNTVTQELAQVKDEDGLNRVLVIVQAIEDQSEKASALSVLAQVFAQTEEKDKLNRVLESLEKIWDESGKALSISSVAPVLAQLGDKNRLNKALAVALAPAEVTRDERWNFYILSDITQAFAQMQDKQGLNQILAAVEAMGHEDLDARALSVIAWALASVEDRVGLSRLLTVTEMIESEYSKKEALKGLVQAMSEAKDTIGLNQLFTITNSIQNEYYKEELLISLVEALIQINEFDQAWKIAFTLQEKKANLQSQVVLALIQAGNFEKAVKLLENIDWNKADSYYQHKIVENWLQIDKQDGLDKALEIVETFSSGYAKFTSLQSISQALVQIENQDGLDKVLLAARAISDEADRTNALHDVAQALAQMGEFDKAIATTKEISESWHRGSALSNVAVLMAQAGQLEQALIVAVSIEDENGKASALKGIAPLLVEADERDGLKQILAIAESMESWKEGVFISVAEALAQVGEFAQALRAAEAIKDELNRVQVLNCIAKAMIQANHKTEISKVLATAKAIASENLRADVRTEVSKLLAQEGELDWALIASIGIGAEEAKAKALLQIAQTLAQVQKFNCALTVVESIEEEQIRTEALIELMQALVQAENKTVFHRALSVVEGINKEEHKSQVLKNLAQILVQIEDEYVVSRVLTAVETIKTEYDKMNILSEVAQALATRGDETSLSKALTLAESVEELGQANLLSAIAPILAQAKDIVGLNRVLAAAEVLKEEVIRAMALSVVAQGFAQAKDIAGLNRLLTLAENIKSEEYWKAQVLSDVALGFGQVADKAGLNQLLMVSETLTEEESKEIVLSSIAQSLALVGEIDQALVMAEPIVNRVLKAKALGCIAQILAEIGEIERAVAVANTIVDYAMKAQGIYIDQTKIDILDGVAQRLVQVRNKNGLERVMMAAFEEAGSNWLVADGLKSRIALSLSRVGEFELAVNMVNSIWEEKIQSKALIEVAQVFASSKNKQDLNKLLEIAKKITPNQYRTTALAGVAQSLTEVGDFEQAIAAAHEIEEDWNEALALSKVVLTMAHAKDKSRLDQILIVVQSIKEKYFGADVLSRIAQAFTLLGLSESAISVWRDELAKAQLSGRNEVFNILEAGVPFLALLDGGETLWNLYETMMEVESWWAT